MLTVGRASVTMPGDAPGLSVTVKFLMSGSGCHPQPNPYGPGTEGAVDLEHDAPDVGPQRLEADFAVEETELMLAEAHAVVQSRGSRVAVAVFVSQANTKIHERTVFELAREAGVLKSVVLYFEAHLGAPLARDERHDSERALALLDDGAGRHTQRIRRAEADPR